MRNPAVPVDSDGAFSFSLEAAATMAGIHGAGARRAYMEAANQILARGGTVPASLWEAYGGQKVPRVPLLRPPVELYPAIPMSLGRTSSDSCAEDVDNSLRNIVDDLITAASDQRRWCERAQVLLAFFDRQLQFGQDVPAAIRGEAMATILTATLENLGEAEINCLEAAAFYVLTKHQEWSHAARSWLLPVRNTWLADWIAARPTYLEIAKQIGRFDLSVPSWLQRSERAG
jgi:hypothetical protein